MENKFPGTSVGPRVAAASGLGSVGSAAGFSGQNQVNSSLPCQTGRFEQHQDGPGCKKVPQSGKHTGVVCTGRVSGGLWLEEEFDHGGP